MAAYRQLEAGQTVRLPGKSLSYKGWSESLQQWARGATAQVELDAWCSRLSGPALALPRELDGISASHGDKREVRLAPTQARPSACCRLRRSWACVSMRCCLPR